MHHTVLLQVNKLEITADKQFLAAAGNPSIKIFEVNSPNSQPLQAYDGHSGNVTAVGFQKDSKWMFRHAPTAPAARRQCRNWHAFDRSWTGPEAALMQHGHRRALLRCWLLHLRRPRCPD